MRAILILILGLLAGPLFINVGIKDYKDSKALQANGKIITAQVTDGEERVSRKGRRSYWLTVSFTPEGRREAHTQKASVSSDVYARAGQERTIEVTYLPSNPTILRLSDKVRTETGMFIVGCLILLATVGYMVYLWRTLQTPKQAPASFTVNPGTDSGTSNQTDFPKAA